MLSLGHPRYITQGGDWGFYITRAMGLLYPSAVLASHINMIRASPPTWTSHPFLALRHSLFPYSARERAGLARGQWFAGRGGKTTTAWCSRRCGRWASRSCWYGS